VIVLTGYTKIYVNLVGKIMIKSLIAIFIMLFTNNVIANTVTARSWLIADTQGKIIQEFNSDSVRSIASITKLITAMIVLDAKQDLNEKINNRTREELLQLALVHSDNQAASILCDKYPGGRASCILALNDKAQNLGLVNTKFIEPTGLSIFNVSTAREVLKIINLSISYPEIVTAGHTHQLVIHNKKRLLTFNNTNPLVSDKGPIVVSKTGFTSVAGGCLAMVSDTLYGRRTVVLLGSKNTRTRIPEAEIIIKASQYD